MTSRPLLYFMTSTLIFARPGPASDSPSEPQVTVHVYDYSSTPRSGLQKAEAEASLLFAHAHIELIWIYIPMRNSDDRSRERTGRWADGANLVLNLLPETRVARLHCPLTELGSTTGVTSSVFVDRIQSASRYLDPYIILGHVIAHELAHALGVHHSRGLMSKNISADWPVQAEQHWLQFSPKQVAQMEQTVRNQAATFTPVLQ